MGEMWGQISITQGGAAAIVALIVLLVLLGRLVPLRQLEALRQDKDQQIQELRAERDTWRTTATEEAVARREIQAQNGELLELARTAGNVLTALPRPAGVTASAPVDQAASAN